MKLGQNLDTGGDVLVSQEVLCSGCYIIGRQGRGKSSLLEFINHQQMNTDKSVIVIDAHGDLVENIIARMPERKIKDTYLLDLKDRKYPFGLNIFACTDPDDIEQWDATRNQVMHAFEKIWPVTTEQVFFKGVLQAIVVTLIDNPTLTMAHIPRLLEDASFRKQYMDKVKNFAARYFWDKYEKLSPYDRGKQIDPLLRRLLELFNESVITNMICQPHANINFHKFIAGRKNLLVKLPVEEEAYKKNAPIIGTMLMAMIYAATFSFSDVDKRPGFTLIVDEFQNFATDENAKLFSGGRKYGAKQFLAHQYQGQLVAAGLGAYKESMTTANTIVAFSTTPEDSRDLARSFAGVKRRPTNIDIDVFPGMKVHPNPLVKEFYLHYVSKLQEGAKMRFDIVRGTNILLLPSLNFGFGYVEFLPDNAAAALKVLNDLLYYAQKEARVDEKRKEVLLYVYGKLVGLIREEYAKDIDKVVQQRLVALREKIRALQEQLAEHDRVRSVNEKAWEERHIAQTMAIINDGSNIAWLNGLKYRLVETVKAQWNRRNWVGPHGGWRDTMTAEEKKDFLGEEAYHTYDFTLSTKQPEQELAQHEAELKKVKSDNQKQRELSDKKRGELEKSEAALKNELDELEAKKVEIDKTEKIEQLLYPVLEALIAEPIAADSAYLSASDIAEQLQKQDVRFAFVKIGSEVYTMKTYVLNEKPYFDNVQKWRERRAQIVIQTREKFCRSRDKVEQEIQHVFAIPGAVIAPEPVVKGTVSDSKTSDESATDDTWQPYEEV